MKIPTQLTSLTILAALSLASASCGANRSASSLDEAWNPANDPVNLREGYVTQLATLPLQAELESKPWTDTYWPSYQGGLAQRWNDPTRPDAFHYELLDEPAIRQMSEEALKVLSPAEKYDVFIGRFDYPLVLEERERTSPEDPSWFGLCHGWAPAALNFAEPNPVTMTSASGIRVPFGSSDVKALLLFAQQYGTEWRSVGERCNANGSNTNECQDINAGTFHVVLANQIGLLKAGFVAEVARGHEVWNQPVFGFSSQILGESDQIYTGAAAGTSRIVTVRTRLDYVSEMAPRWEPMPMTDFPGQRAQRTYEYTLEVSATDEILGGRWVSTDHPDFFWTQAAPRLQGYFAGLGAIYDAATR